jgi:uncharacterized protein YjbJ (UPF0337 family)
MAFYWRSSRPGEARSAQPLLVNAKRAIWWHVRRTKGATARGDESGTFRAAKPLTCYFSSIPERRGTMDRDRVEGSAKQVKGSIKDTAGKMTGDAKLQGEGKADKAEGKIQNTVGGLKDSLRENK